jgi:Flp pilus assembly protein TadG
VTGVTASGAIGRDNPWQQRGVAMPILLMALLALLVFGLIGILLTVAVVLEQSKRKRAAKSDAAHAVTSGGPPSLNPKLR